MSTVKYTHAQISASTQIQIHTLTGDIMRKGTSQETQRQEQNRFLKFFHTSSSSPVHRAGGLSQIQFPALLGFEPHGFVYSFIKVIFHSPKIDFSSVINKNVIFHITGLSTAGLSAGPQVRKISLQPHPHPTPACLPGEKLIYCLGGLMLLIYASFQVISILFHILVVLNFSALMFRG